MKSILRRLRGTLGNALLWAGAWFLAAFPVNAVLPFIIRCAAEGHLFGGSGVPRADSGNNGLRLRGVFSLYLGTAGRNQRLHELSAGRVALGTGITVGVLMTVFLVLSCHAQGLPGRVASDDPGVVDHWGDRGSHSSGSGQNCAERADCGRAGSRRIGVR